MAFKSKYASLIWDKIYSVYIPDYLTLNADYIKIFGTHVTGDKGIDNMLSTALTHVMIPVIQIVEYFDNGIEIQIPSREDMLQIYKDIELYLGEWKYYVQHDINLDVREYKELLTSLEKLSKHIYDKAKPNELITNLFAKNNLGISNRLAEYDEAVRISKSQKPDYDGISKLIRTKVAVPKDRFS